MACLLFVFWAVTAIVSPAQTFNLSTLASFDGTDGADANASLVQGTDGNFYGTTKQGGADNVGTVFKITPNGVLSTLYSFAADGCVRFTCNFDGFSPAAGLVQGTDGNLYGTTTDGGGIDRDGTVFKITPAGAMTILYSFCSESGCTDGANPYSALVQGTDGNFYGTTSAGGAFNIGTVFKITPAGVLTRLYSFCP